MCTNHRAHGSRDTHLLRNAVVCEGPSRRALITRAERSAARRDLFSAAVDQSTAQDQLRAHRSQS